MEQSADSDYSEHTQSAQIIGLQPGTTYQFRIVATNSSGTSYGADKTFTTLAVKPVATTGAASSVTTTGAALNGTVNPQNQATAYHFECGTSTAYGSRVPASNAAVGSDYSDHAISQAISGLSASTAYHFRLVATNATGTTYGSTGRSQLSPSRRRQRASLDA